MTFSFPEPVQDIPLEFINHPVELIRVKGTRIPIDTIIAAYQRGDTVTEIDVGFPTVGLSNIFAILSYYVENQTMIDAYLARGEAFAEKMQDKWESLHPQNKFPRKVNGYKAEMQTNAQILGG